MRYASIDGLRGLFVLAMASSHYAVLGPSIGPLDYRWISFADSSQGFVFLSGLTFGLVMTRKVRSTGIGCLGPHAARRALLVYKYHVATLLFAIVVTATMGGAHPLLVQASSGHAVLNAVLGVLLLHQPPYLDILPLYLILIALTPFAIRAFERGHGLAVLAASGVLWIAAPISPLVAFFEVATAAAGAADVSGVYRQNFNPFAWQMVYAVGLYLGWRLANERLPTDALRTRRAAHLAALAAVLGIVLLVYRNLGMVPLASVQRHVEILELSQRKTEVTLYVALGAAGFGYLTAWLHIGAPRSDVAAIRWLGRAAVWITTRPILQSVGRQSIRAFAAHLFWLFGASAAIARLDLNAHWASVLFFAGFGAILLVVGLGERGRSPPAVFRAAVRQDG